MKKILIFILILLFWNIFIENIFAEEGFKETVEKDWNTTTTTIISDSWNYKQTIISTATPCQNCTTQPSASPNNSKEAPTPPSNSKEAPTPWEWLNSSSYMFSTKDFVPGWTYSSWWKTEKKFSNWLITIIRKLVIPFWVLAVFVMTIWAWYMILSNWNDEMLNKWKKIFKMWIFSTVIVLSSYIIVELVKNLLYA